MVNDSLLFTRGFPPAHSPLSPLHAASASAPCPQIPRPHLPGVPSLLPILPLQSACPCSSRGRDQEETPAEVLLPPGPGLVARLGSESLGGYFLPEGEALVPGLRASAVARRPTPVPSASPDDDRSGVTRCRGALVLAGRRRARCLSPARCARRGPGGLLGSPGTGPKALQHLSRTSSRPVFPQGHLPTFPANALCRFPCLPSTRRHSVVLRARSVVCWPDASSRTFPPVSATLSGTRDPFLSPWGPVGCLLLVRRQALCWREARVLDTHARERWLLPGGLSGTAPHPHPAQRPYLQPLLRRVGYRALLVSPLDTGPRPVSWSQQGGGAENTDLSQLPVGQVPAMPSRRQWLKEARRPAVTTRAAGARLLQPKVAPEAPPERPGQ